MPRVDLDKAKEMYPACAMGVDEWVTFFGSPAGQHAMGSIIYDIWDEVQSNEEYRRGQRRIGRRPKREASSLDEIFSTLFPDEFTLEPMRVALPPLMAGRFQAEFAAEIPITQSYMSYILTGRRVPNLELIERIAAVAGVKPWYFAEWRAQYVAKLLGDVLMRQPNLGISAVKHLKHLRGGVRR